MAITILIFPTETNLTSIAQFMMEIVYNVKIVYVVRMPLSYALYIKRVDNDRYPLQLSKQKTPSRDASIEDINIRKNGDPHFDYFDFEFSAIDRYVQLFENIIFN